MRVTIASVAYHVTPRRNLERILAEGLRKDVAGWDAGYIWMFTCREAAVESASQNWACLRDNVILEVDVHGLTLLRDPHPGFSDWRQEHSVAVASNIEPTRISVARD